MLLAISVLILKDPKKTKKRDNPPCPLGHSMAAAKSHIPAWKDMLKSMFDQGGTAGKFKEGGSNFQTGI